MLKRNIPDLMAPGILENDAEIEKYSSFSAVSPENSRRLLVYLAVKYLGRPGAIEPPEKYENRWFYHPGHEGTFASADEFLRWRKSSGRDINAPRALIETNMGHVTGTSQTLIDGLILEFERQGILAVALNTIEDTYEKHITDFKPDVLLIWTGKSGKIEFYTNLGAPRLQPMTLMGETIDQWRNPPVDDKKRPPGGGMGMMLVTRESQGIIEPHVVAGSTVPNRDFSKPNIPIPDRMKRFVARAAAYAHLAHKSNLDKKIAIQYLGPPEKDEILVGTQDTVYAESIINLLKQMKQKGYSITNIPEDQNELIGRMIDHGRQILSGEPAELDRLARSGQTMLLPVETYKRWFEAKVPKAQREAVIREWGAVPGKFMVWKDDNGKQYIVIPKIDLGNVVLVPAQGPEIDEFLEQENRKALLARIRKDPYNIIPSHNQLAVNFWIEEGFKTDALIVWEFLVMDYTLPRKMVGLSESDWPDILMGDMPNFRVWPICELNLSLPARRRTCSVLTDHLISPDTTAGVSDELLNLQNDIIKWDQMSEGALEGKFRASITRQARQAHLDQDMHLSLKDGQVLTPEEVRELAGYLNNISREKINVNLHVLGQTPKNELLIPWIVSCLRSRFLEGLSEVITVPKNHDRLPGDRKKYLRAKAEELVGLFLNRNLSAAEAINAIDGKLSDAGMPEKLKEGFNTARQLYDGFAKTHLEIDNILLALDGKFVPPGPGNLPERNPAVVPTGKNMYIMNPEEIPSKPSWELGKQLVDELLAEKLNANGRYPEKIGLSLDFRSTLMDYGVLESQILYLMGVRPVWDASNRVLDVELIPAKELGRPRIDVFIETYDYYVDYLESRLRLWDKAVRMVSKLDEPDNYLFRNREKAYRELKASGMPAERAETLSCARIFAMPPEMLTFTHFLLLEETGDWDSRRELVDVYLAERDYVYTEGCWGKPELGAYKAQLQGTDVILRNITRGGPLAAGWYNGGNLCLVVKELTGRKPDYFVSDLRNPGEEKVVLAEDAMKQDMRATLFNRNWIEGMMKEGYAGAQQMSGGVFSTLGWEINREKSISAETWQEITDIYVRDKKNLNIREFFDTNNPYALQGITQNLLEATRKGYWSPDAATLMEITTSYAQSVVRYGHREPGELNKKLEAFIARTLSAPGPGSQTTKALLDQYRRKTASEMAPPKIAGAQSDVPAVTSPAQPQGQVTGNKLEKIQTNRPDIQKLPEHIGIVLTGLSIILLFLIGFWKRIGVINYDKYSSDKNSADDF
jgi:cobaltochelatase CobN